MVARLLLLGLLAGLLAGLLSFGVARVVGEPQVDRAIAFEQRADAARARSRGQPVVQEEEIVSRRTQAGMGLLTGVVVFGMSMGGLFALCFALLYGRGRRLAAPPLAALLAAAGFVALVLVPLLKYPPNPPAVGNPETIGDRTALYFCFLGLSVAAMALSFRACGRLIGRLGEWYGVMAAVALYAVLVGMIGAVLPGVSEVPADFPAEVLWHFRVAAVGVQLVMWVALGAIFGALVAYDARTFHRGVTPRSYSERQHATR